MFDADAHVLGHSYCTVNTADEAQLCFGPYARDATLVIHDNTPKSRLDGDRDNGSAPLSQRGE